MKRLLIAALLLCTLALPACGDDKPTLIAAGDGSPVASLSAARARWAEKGSNSYVIAIEASCFCPQQPKWQSEVVDGRPPTVTNPAWFDQRMSVPGLFDFIEAAIKSGAAEARVSYDESTGAPTSIFIDRSKNIADEELMLTVTVTPK